MFRAILLQVWITLAVVVVAGLVVGVRGAVSAAAGGAVCVFPNVLFAWRLKSTIFQSGAKSLANFYLGELVKVALTISLLMLTVKMYADLHWPSMLIGLVLASQAMFLAFWKKTDHVNRP